LKEANPDKSKGRIDDIAKNRVGTLLLKEIYCLLRIIE